jgi:GH25 family lysozyme M1 (1,4-beta-N-acetylmuramidase)
MVAALLVTVAGAVLPRPALGATVLAARCDSVAARTRPSLAGPKKAVLSKGERVVAIARVKGGQWTTRCGGGLRSGSAWYRLTTIGGRTVVSRYGVSYLFVTVGQLRVLYTTTGLQAACDGVRLRTKPGTTASTPVTLSAGATVTASGVVSGGSWAATCAGKASSGSSWYMIIAVGGRSVSSLYGVAALYGARGLFVSASTKLADAGNPGPTPTPTPTPSPSGSGSIEGIDVSHWQSTIDWVAVAGAGKRFAFMKATDGQVDSTGAMYVDPMYATNRAGATANGLLIGAYHFARPDATPGDAIAEADHFVDVASPAAGDILPVLDLEQTGGLNPAALQAWVEGFLGEVYARTGVRGIIYVSPSFWSNKLNNTPALANEGYRVLWIAHWTSASQPTVPAGNWGGNGWTFWQYTSSGSVPGIAGNVDLDRYRFTDFAPVLMPTP